MNAKDISSKKFDRGFNGYKPDDVDDFLKDIADEFSKLQKDNRDFEKKLEVLADKVREYRDDEEALKEALLGAQKQGHAAIAQAKEKSKKILEETRSKSEEILAEARENSKKLGEQADETIRKAGDDAKRIQEEAAEKQATMEIEFKNKLELNKEILLKTKNEVTRFRQKLLEDFTRVTGIIETLPEACENEFVSRTVTEYQKERNVTLKKAASKPEQNGQDNKKKSSDKPSFANVDAEKDNGDSDSLFEEFAAKSKMVSEKKSSFEHSQDITDSADDSVNDSEEKDAPFFKKDKKSEDREALEFGNHAKG
ncbi:MAG: DivIVA domain-containing protein [Oscillospiraceae bacterium]|nr:DivIVA domain-containing protein [Oscillospiraceae bacterium]